MIKFTTTFIFISSLLIGEWYWGGSGHSPRGKEAPTRREPMENDKGNGYGLMGLFEILVETGAFVSFPSQTSSDYWFFYRKA